MGARECLGWLALDERPHVHFLGSDMGVFEPIIRNSTESMGFQIIGPPDWGYTSSYCVTESGDLWACVATGSFLVRRSAGGGYSIAIANNSVEFREEAISYREADQGLRISAIRALPDDSLLLAGYTGIYRLEEDELVQVIAFTGGDNSESSGVWERPWGYDLTNVLLLDDGSYLISNGSGGGIYLLRPDDEDQWGCLSLNEGDPVVW